jgi:abhydrolase domain-containing protein 5
MELYKEKHILAPQRMDAPCNPDNITEKHEEALLKCVGLERNKDYTIRDVEFPLVGNQRGHIHTIEAGHQNKEVLVLIHGYGSGAAFYYKMIANLKDIFHIYAIDMFGFGSSSRPPLPSFDFSEVVQFFVDGLEGWRQVLNLQNFVLMGHSLGGYISSHWVRIKNPPLKMLYLLSPAGFTNRTDAEIKELSSFLQKPLLWAYDYLLHDKKKNPLGWIPFAKEFFIKQKFSGSRIAMPDDEATNAAKYLASHIEKSECGERSVGVLLRYARYSQYPICQILEEILNTRGFDYPIVVLYGETDWMDFHHASQMNIEMGLMIHVGVVDKCDHQIILQNPDGLADRMRRDFQQGYENLAKVDSCLN